MCLPRSRSITAARPPGPLLRKGVAIVRAVRADGLPQIFGDSDARTAHMAVTGEKVAGQAHPELFDLAQRPPARHA